ncbi:hypothetical protein SAV14893_085560 [Streptomyces avermitilis]|uniref:DUF6234 domain-containing protein n=1 Tax=Streptomyces avermitilis TaxID=33903 RepID=A0A4D4MBC0_STRAX|nr:hypothetical protein SAVMC3_11060 [Streptomyces avermitilis]GDY69163.1 hypothetical protein SAV14893_085560 [Streptomyces avermitilis]GDY79411.1 hypothetical protein SAV31267_088960 [Streptomyces avermitilis]GDY88348.1 hypothetical protein SAVCW2_75470 [Streptomyces avermitilis]
MDVSSERTGRGLAVALVVVEMAILALIGLSWMGSYWSWDPQHHGDPPGPYLKKAAVVPIAALVAMAVAGIRRMRAVAVSQAVMFIVICGTTLCLKAPGERVYEDSYRNACHAGMGCGDDSPTTR